ncbi:hypothetical protein GCM10020358_24890 [Amorphoplanes nipponensis]|uniref:CHAT domain-containing protein n=1 Tax=Actinoplanes nipponensis TaxID=135950 RepID=A0A919MQ91_9ACTN|nr:hypothetical protein Ani05nite_69400 [Actinoplanes nipponensis]
MPVDRDTTLAEALSWYLEDYVHHPTRPGDHRSRYVLEALRDWGRYVFHHLFSTRSARAALTEAVSGALFQGHRIAVLSDDPTVLAWPWEALFGEMSEPIGLSAVLERCYTGEVATRDRPEGAVRAAGLEVLLVTARSVANDIPYRIIGRDLAASADVRLTLLRPATLDALVQATGAHGRHWDVLHFDCHGWWGATSDGLEQAHLLLPDIDGNLRPYSSRQLVQALGERCPRTIVINACRSGKAEGAAVLPYVSLATGLLQHSRVEEVTAMGYNLHRDAVAPFVEAFYHCLAEGSCSADAALSGRRLMKQRPERTCVGGAIAVEDWLIPVVYSRADEDLHPDVRGAVAMWPPAFTPDAAVPLSAPAGNELFVGRDELIQALDRAVDTGFQLVYLHGIIGQGKTALLSEFLWWRDRTGDHRPALRIDFEERSDASDVLWTMAQSLPNTPAVRPADDHLETFVVDALNDHPRIVIWDHTHVADRPVDGLALPGTYTYTDTDRDRLARLVGRVRAGTSVVLAAGRRDSSWLQAGCRSSTLLVPGLGEDDRWALVRAERGRSRPDDVGGTRVAPEGHFSNLVTVLNGHPALTRHVAALRLDRTSAGDLLHALREKAGIPAVIDKDGERLGPVLHCLREPVLARAIPQILLHGPAVNPPVLGEALREMHGAGAENDGAQVMSLLQAAGLADKQGALHPMLPSVMRAQSAVAPVDHEQALAFLSAVRVCLQEGREPGLAVELLDHAADLAIEHGQLGYARQFGLQLLRVGEADRGRRVLALCVTRSALGSQPPDVEVATALQLAELALSRRQFDQAHRWTETAQARIRSTTGAVPADLRARLLFYQGRLAEATSDWSGFRDSMMAASRLIAEISDSALAVQIAHYVSQLAADPQLVVELVATIAIDESAEDSPDLLSYLYQVRARASQTQGEMSKAGEAARRAVSLAKLSTDDRTYANAQAVLGTVELAAGNLAAAVSAFTEAATRFEATGDRLGAGAAYNALGRAYYRHDRMEQAGEYLIHAAVCFAESGHEHNLQTVEVNFATYLEQLTPEFADFMSIRWAGAGLPPLSGRSSEPPELVEFSPAMGAALDQIKNAAAAAPQPLAASAPLVSDGDLPRPTPERALADDLSRRGVRLAGERRFDEAEMSLTDAVEIYRRLADTGAADSELSLAQALHNTAVVLARQERNEDALTSLAEAAEVYRRLAVTDPSRTPALADALHLLCQHLLESDHFEQARDVAADAVNTYRSLAADAPEFAPKLAESLYEQAMALSGTDQRDDAAGPMREAVQVFRELSEARPGEYDRELAHALHGLGLLHASGQRTGEALSAVAASVATVRAMAADGAEESTAELAEYLGHQAALLLALDVRQDQASAAADEAVRILRRLSRDRPQAYRERLSRAEACRAAAAQALSRARLGPV